MTMEPLSAIVRRALRPRYTDEVLERALRQYAPEHAGRGCPKEAYLRLEQENPEAARRIMMHLLDQVPETREDRVRRERVAEVRSLDRLDFLQEVEPGIPETGETLENFQRRPQHPDVQEALAGVRDWVLGLGPGILVLSGPPGVGKSHLAIGAAKVLQSSGKDVAYRREPGLLTELQSNFGGGKADRILEELLVVPWLILDELGVAHARDWAQAQLDNLVNARWDGAKGEQRTLVATNLVGDQLPARMASRLRDVELARALVVHATDWRAHRGRET